MLPYPKSFKEKAIQLRKNGSTINEISKTLKIAKSTSSAWVSKIILDDHASKVLKKKKFSSFQKLQEINRIMRIKKKNWYKRQAENILISIPKDKNIYKLLCATLYWAEGQKIGNYHLAFTNSDPKMIQAFLSCLRKGFVIDESKLRVNAHIHEYHNESMLKNFWSEITEIPLNQFTKSYLKPHTKKVTRENYPGCVRISYYSADVWHQIEAIYTELGNII